MNLKESQTILKFLLDLSDKRSRSVVGKLCEQMEKSIKDGNVNLDMQKEFAKKIIYNEGQKFNSLLKAYFMPKITFKE